MRLISQLVAAATLVSASVLETDTLEARHLEERQSAQCAIKGTRILPTFSSSTQTSLAVPDQCGALCKATFLCQSYAVDGKTCYMYLLGVTRFIKKDAAGPFTFYDKACTKNTDLCWVYGTTKSSIKPFQTSSSLKDGNWPGCSGLCKKTSGCKSYSINADTGTCSLYRDATAKTLQIPLDPKSATGFWDVNCVLSAAPLPPLPAQPAAVAQSIAAAQASADAIPKNVSPASFEPSPDYTPKPVNSPDGTNFGEQPKFGGFADDNEFIEKYTFEQYDLPTPVAMGQAPITTGFAAAKVTDLPVAPCLASSGPQAQFSVLNENYLPLVSKTSGRIGPLSAPTAQPASSDPLAQPVDSVALPLFYLQAPAGAPANTYDLLYAGSSLQYVALQDNGNVVLRSASSGANFVGGFATTIFSVDCAGRLSINQGGQAWTWNTDGATTKMTRGAVKNKNFLSLPHDLPAIRDAKKHRKRYEEMGRKLLAKRNKYQDGGSPKCPNLPGRPGDLVAKTKLGYERDQGNMCENYSEYWELSPYSFEKSCIAQSLCYDQCEDYQWETCNGIFGALMLASCPLPSSLWDIPGGIACRAQAGYFVGVAATSKGREVHRKAQDAMCKCFCPDPNAHCEFISGPRTGEFYCTNVNTNDDANCGACGRDCGPKAKCKSGTCGCPKDQCGTTCLEFRNNPNHCGKCDNKCDPPYCVSGKCYKPEPGQCAPDDPIRNTDIVSGLGSQWFAGFEAPDGQQDGCAYDTNVKPGTATFEGKKYYTMKLQSLPANQGCAGYVVQNKVKICPGFKYSLTFSGRTAKGLSVNNVNWDQTAQCTVTWALGRSDKNGNYGEYQSHTWNVNDERVIEYSGWEFNIQKTDKGVTTDKDGSYVDLQARIRCFSSNAGRQGLVLITDVEVKQVGTV